MHPLQQVVPRIITTPARIKSMWFHLVYINSQYQLMEAKVGALILLLVVLGVIYRRIYPLHQDRHCMCMWVGQEGLTLQAIMGVEWHLAIAGGVEEELVMSVPQLGTCSAG